jgi:hypothetical protein
LIDGVSYVVCFLFWFIVYYFYSRGDRRRERVREECSGRDGVAIRVGMWFLTTEEILGECGLVASNHGLLVITG